MRHLLFLWIALVLISQPVKAQPNEEGFQQYVKWVNQAREAAQQQYPNANWIDFLYIGCEAQSPSATNQIYKFWMREGQEEFGVYVTVTVNNNSQKGVVSSIEKTESLIPAYSVTRERALQEVKSKYPSMRIVDYHPYGCRWVSNDVASQSFSFWLEENDVQRFLKVTITYKIRSKEVLSVNMEEIRKPIKIS